MRLLVFTQALDRNDPVLGFFHRWVVEFAKNFSEVHVVALSVGEYDIPENVTVHSLGKESGAFRAKYIFNFYRFLFMLRGRYDAVFVHMNPEYVLLGGFLWRARRKKVALWYNHKKGSFFARIAVAITDCIFYTSDQAYMSTVLKARMMPAGIDTTLFSPGDEKREKNSVLIVGRISPVKRVSDIVRAALKMNERGFLRQLHIVGSIPKRDRSYGDTIKRLAEPLVESGQALFHGGVEIEALPALYRNAELYINATPAGSFDKTVLEAMACGTLVLTSNSSFFSMLPESMQCAEGDIDAMAHKAELLLSLPETEKEALRSNLREQVVHKHSLEQLITEIQYALYE
ncbi:hypothetical protein COU17_03350 [Candidatus Kaiserbacteria bacterium CG10_big_fil_rev_8_21_14_0_10_49_17]|uniref:Glycosyl transferase family 1 domain-containing protein n=1 Tax=Candidatus Kaiserbacteria bacterium CG10_big_fil_rev_8_21_14_0_10_49_17 TaxID=1974609 RepID=A0A2M6WDV3_9BACT|nr:MAG: hypothetical protein COU17_03350 [Candidatus Kaiserbacteria bacterium CG10_big_fil_rev_8_21_14_0_10_49_17]